MQRVFTLHRRCITAARGEGISPLPFRCCSFTPHPPIRLRTERSRQSVTFTLFEISTSDKTHARNKADTLTTEKESHTGRTQAGQGTPLLSSMANAARDCGALGSMRRCQVTDQLDRARERAFGDLRDHRRPPMRHLVAHGWTLPPRRTTAHRRQWARWQRMRAAVQQSPWPRVQARERAARSRHEARERARVDARAAADAQHWAEWHEALDRGGRRLSVSYFTVPPRAHSVSGCVLPSFSQYPASASRYSGAAAARSP